MVIKLTRVLYRVINVTEQGFTEQLTVQETPCFYRTQKLISAQGFQRILNAFLSPLFPGNRLAQSV